MLKILEFGRQRKEDGEFQFRPSCIKLKQPGLGKPLPHTRDVRGGEWRGEKKTRIRKGKKNNNPIFKTRSTLSCGSIQRNIVGTAFSFSNLLLHSLLKQSGVKCSEQILLYLVGLKFFLLTAASHCLQRPGRVRGNLRRQNSVL